MNNDEFETFFKILTILDINISFTLFTFISYNPRVYILSIGVNIFNYVDFITHI